MKNNQAEQKDASLVTPNPRSFTPHTYTYTKHHAHRQRLVEILK